MLFSCSFAVSYQKATNFYTLHSPSPLNLLNTLSLSTQIDIVMKVFFSVWYSHLNLGIFYIHTFVHGMSVKTFTYMHAVGIWFFISIESISPSESLGMCRVFIEFEEEGKKKPRREKNPRRNTEMR